MHGCHNRQPFKDWYYAQDGYQPMSSDKATSRLPRIVKVPHVMTRDCQYSKHTTDARCAGCCHQQKEDA